MEANNKQPYPPAQDPYTITINDTFCTWEYKLEGLSSYAIQELIDIIEKHAGGVEISSRLIDSIHH